MDIKNCRLKKTHMKDTTKKYMYGFILMAKGAMIDFYTDSEEELQLWINELKNYVILLDWKEELKMGPLLGEGHFASVKLCHRMSDLSTSYALKTIKKSTVKKSRKNIVSRT